MNVIWYDTEIPKYFNFDTVSNNPGSTLLNENQFSLYFIEYTL
jgi:hypothetical protein